MLPLLLRRVRAPRQSHLLRLVLEGVEEGILRGAPGEVRAGGWVEQRGEKGLEVLGREAEGAGRR